MGYGPVISTQSSLLYVGQRKNENLRVRVRYHKPRRTGDIYVAYYEPKNLGLRVRLRVTVSFGLQQRRSRIFLGIRVKKSVK